MPRRVAVLDHGMGNLRSVAKALEAAGADVVVTAEPAEVARGDALCVPGQGIFGRCVSRLRACGADDVVREWIATERPYLGICLGMQILFDASDEGAGAAGLGVFGGRSRRLPATVRVPHIGWNTVDGEHYYFDHSFAVHPDDPAIVAGWCEHGDSFAALIRHGSVLGTQFHPEKSARAGIRLLAKWLAA